MSIRIARWGVGLVGGTLVALAIVAGAGSRTESLRKLVIDTLSDRLDSEVELETFSVDTFPAVHVTGSGLTIRHKGRRDVPPLVAVRSFRIDGGLLGLLSRPRRFRTLTLTGLQVNIPPGGFKGRDARDSVASPEGSKAGAGAIVIDKLVADEASISLIPKRAGKEPRVFAVHALTVEPLGRGHAMSYAATVMNPVPKGLVHATGTFGPWHREDPGGTPLTGSYTFDNVNLATVKGIGGTLSSAGTFGGQLDRIRVTGTTNTPDFRVNVSGNPVPLQTKFDAVVDGTDGDTYLNAVSATFLRSALTARGAIVGAEGVKGRAVRVHVKIDDGRIEDVLRLAMKGNTPLITGRLDLHADMNLPAGPEDVIERLDIAGEFGVATARFSDGSMRAKISDMSERARGLKPVEHSQNVISDLKGEFRLDRGVLTVQGATFWIPGATVQIAGTYALRNEAIAFDGTVRMRATISQAAGGGLKSFFLKAVDPLFRRQGAGAVLPIRIRGSRDEPRIGLDVGRVFGRH